ncbi:hypothetical protein G9A89_015199 [Geosiphon pyriformis]|nr:hypothetical protein G9A89_015199 [Geosiphon pyriformis]
MPTAPLIEFEKEEKKLTWEAYQVFWANKDYNELPLILSWDDKKKRRTYLECQPSLKDNNKKKGKEEEEICVDCGKKLSSMSACCDNNKKYSTATKFYCRSCVIEWFRCPKRQRKWDNKPCLACGAVLSNKGMSAKELQLMMPEKECCDDWKNILTMNMKSGKCKLLEIKNNPLSLPKPEYILTFNVFGNMKDDLKEFHEHYQQLTPTKKE